MNKEFFWFHYQEPKRFAYYHRHTWYWKLFLMKLYTAQHFQLFGKNIQLLATTSVITLHLNSIATTIHITFGILTQRYLSTRHEPSNVIEHFKNKHVININKMSMMTNNKLCSWIMIKTINASQKHISIWNKTHITCWTPCPTIANL